jgi:hypothetical protein
MLRSCALAALAALPVLLAAPAAEGKAAFMDLEQTIALAEAIAVVHVHAAEPGEFVGEHWTYRQRVKASPRFVIKGELEPDFVIMADKSFICAPVEYEAPGDYLVFLERDNGQWVTLNHDMGQLAVHDFGQVDWPYTPTPFGAAGRAPLGEAIREIREHLRTRAECEIVLRRDDADGDELATAEVPRDATGGAEAPAPARVWFAIGTLGGSAAILLGFVAGWRARSRRRQT